MTKFSFVNQHWLPLFSGPRLLTCLATNQKTVSVNVLTNQTPVLTSFPLLLQVCASLRQVLVSSLPISEVDT